MAFSGIDSINRYNKPQMQINIPQKKFSFNALSVFFESSPILTINISNNYLNIKLLNLKLNYGFVKYVYFYISGSIITNSDISQYKPFASSSISNNYLDYKIDLTTLDVSLENFYVGALFIDNNGNYIKQDNYPYILQNNYKSNTSITPPIVSSNNYISNINIIPTNNIVYDKDNKQLLGSINFNISYLGNVFIKYISIDIADRSEYIELSKYNDFKWKNLILYECESNINTFSVDIKNIPVAIIKLYHSFKFVFYDKDNNIIPILPFDNKIIGSINSDSTISISDDNAIINNGLSYSIFLMNDIPIDYNAVLVYPNILLSSELSSESDQKCYLLYTKDNSYYLINHEFYDSSIDELDMFIDDSVQAINFGKSLVSNINMFPTNHIYNIGSDIQFIKNSGIKILTYLSYDISNTSDISVILKSSMNTYCLTRHFFIENNSNKYEFNFYLNGDFVGTIISVLYDLNIYENTEFPFVIREDDMFLYPGSDPSEVYQYLFIEPTIIDIKRVKEYTYYKSFNISSNNKTTTSVSDFSSANISTISDNDIDDGLKSMLRSKQQLQTLTQFIDE